MATNVMSPIAVDVTEKSRQIASASEVKFLGDPSPQTARRFLDVVAELGPTVFAPTDGSLEWALAIATRHLEDVNPAKGIKLSNYEFLREVARLYGLTATIKYYDS